jgi:hypothetical protein
MATSIDKRETAGIHPVVDEMPPMSLTTKGIPADEHVVLTPQVEPRDQLMDARRQAALWYGLTCLVPFALSLVLPWLVWQLAASVLSPWVEVTVLLLAGWLPFSAGVAGRAKSASVCGESPAAAPWGQSTAWLAWFLGAWGVFATGFVICVIGFDLLLGGIQVTL